MIEGEEVATPRGPVYLAVLPESGNMEIAILNVAWDMLDEVGSVRKRQLWQRCHLSSRHYAEFVAIFEEWNMATWENGDNGDDSTDHSC